MSTGCERWTFTVELPADVGNGGRYAARILKWLWRTWRVRCTGLEESAEVWRLQGIIDGLAARVAEQSELLTRRGERRDRA
jgi:hypothetical protein